MLCLELEIVHVDSHGIESVIPSVLLSDCSDMRNLCSRIGYRSHFNVRVFLEKVQGKAAPSTPQVHDLHSVLDLCPLADHLKCQIFCLVKRSARARVNTARVLFPSSESKVVILCRNFVMLLIRCLSLYSDGQFFQLLNKSAVHLLLILNTHSWKRPEP